MRIALLLAGILSAPLCAAELRVAWIATAPPCAAGTLSVEPLCGGACSEGIKAASWRVAESAELTLDLDETVAWRLRTAGACWSPDTIIPAGRTDAPITVRLHPAGTVGGRLRLPRGVGAPPKITVKAQSLGTAAIPPSDLACETSGERWSCVAPAAELDLRIEADGFVPHYVWGLRTTAGKRTDGGEITLARGASLSGFVAVDGRGATFDGIRVTVSPSLPPAMGPDWQLEEQRRGLRTLTTTPNAKGFFQFPHLAAGTYDVVVTKEGWSPAKQREVRLAEENETRLDPLRLTPLARLELAIMPPLDPDGKPWGVELVAGQFLKTVTKGPASESGAWTSQPLESGRYDLIVRDTRSIVHVREPVELTEGMPPVGINIKTFPLRGRVTLGGEPLQCELIFTNVYGKRVYMRTGKAGEIVAILPEEGRWRMEVRPPGAGSIIREIDVRKRLDEQHATVEIDLPAGRVEGVVVDTDGKPAKATAYFRGEDRRSGSYSTTEDGKFTFVGLDPGDDIQLFARARGASSAPVPHRVTKDDDGTAVTLILRAKVEISGRVINAAGQPVAGALVRWVTTGASVAERITGARGQFSIDADGNRDVVDLVILPPTPPVKTVGIPLSRAGEPVDIVVGGPSGLLDLLYRGPDGDLGVRRFPLVRGAGGLVPISTFEYSPTFGEPRRDSLPGGTRIEIEPGTYTVCPTPTPSADCITRVVAAGGHEVIDARPFTR